MPSGGGMRVGEKATKRRRLDINRPLAITASSVAREEDEEEEALYRFC